MSSLPPEILDLVLNHVRDEPITLRACCLVSKSWVPWARIHLFARVVFNSPQLFKLWMKAFPDPFDSPAHFTRALRLSGPEMVSFAVFHACPWVRSFSHVVELQVTTIGAGDGQISFTQLHGFSPTLKILSLIYPAVALPQVLDFICSFPLLEDLSLFSSSHSEGDDPLDKWDAPPTLPKFTGSLHLSGKNLYLIRKLLDLPGGLRFSKITMSCPFESGDLKEELVSMCSKTLESLSIEHYPGSSTLTELRSLDLSKAVKLKDVGFLWRGPSVKWISRALKTARSANLRQISIALNFPLPNAYHDEAARLEWEDLDGLLVKLWSTRSIRPVLTLKSGTGEDAQKLLPRLASMGAIPI